MGGFFPKSNQAQSVVDVLADKMEQLGVKVYLHTEICALDTGEHFKLETAEGQVYQARRVVIASGGVSAGKMGADGKGMEIAANLGHEITDLKPGLVALESKENTSERCRELKLWLKFSPTSLVKIG